MAHAGFETATEALDFIFSGKAVVTLTSTSGNIPAALTIQHNDACGRCGRELTDPISVATGLGPICRSR